MKIELATFLGLRAHLAQHDLGHTWIHNGRVFYCDELNGPEIDVSDVLLEQEGLKTTPDEMYVACCDALFDATCVDCKAVTDDPAQYNEEYAPFADLRSGEVLCSDCAEERCEHRDMNKRYGIRNSDFLS